MAGPTRWGVLGTGAISYDFTAAIQMMPDTEHKVAAVAARSLEKALDFNEQFGNSIPKVYGSYAEMAQDDNLDVVYIGTIHPCHYDPAKLMLEAGKHVLVEKPMAMSTAQVQALIQVAKDKNVFLLEGFWSRFFPIYSHLRGELANKTIGDIRSVFVNFGFDVRAKTRFDSCAMGAGATLDIGCYPVMLATMIFNERPERICSSGLLAGDGFDLYTNTTLHYKDGRRAQLNCCMDHQLDNTSTIVGTDGIIKIPNFWSPEQMITPNKTYDCPVPRGEKQMKHQRSEGFMYEIGAVRDCLLAGEKESSLMSLEHSVIINEILEEILKQVGVVYPDDLVK